MVFTNKHVLIAMIVAPVLAVLAWFGAGQLAGESPQPAVAGKSYPLVEQSNCRYASGRCDLENEDVRLYLAPAHSGAELLLTSSIALDGVVLGIGLPDNEPEPAVMRPVDGQGLQWRLEIVRQPASGERIHLVAMAGGTSYFADAVTSFLQSKEG